MFLRRILPWSRYEVVGHSMEPTLKDGSRVWANNWAYFFFRPKIGDIVVFRCDNKFLIKRVKLVSGNSLSLYGDNSLDSQDFGEVPIFQVIGKILSN